MAQRRVDGQAVRAIENGGLAGDDLGAAFADVSTGECGQGLGQGLGQVGQCAGQRQVPPAVVRALATSERDLVRDAAAGIDRRDAAAKVVDAASLLESDSKARLSGGRRGLQPLELTETVDGVCVRER